MAKHRLTDERALAERTVADLDRLCKDCGIDKQIRALMTPKQRADLDRTLRDHARHTRR
ncbi:hypothetical protein [Couchioplanes azureus]|uniref:hypothetical protein n=1 Tax=Couchioplanes caeruleus TaxID=56438 RepID=UPI001670BC32|nr:hypothetical protein [Couchioplanes caeruleus]GGQ77615.1 hypothetical protein GCM10010166_54460 [Couchioplanes caeruleus subsp. azureus]